MLDSGFVGLGENLFPVDEAAADFGEVDSIAIVLRASSRDFGNGVEIFDVNEGEASGIEIEIFQRVASGGGDPAQVHFHLDQIGVAQFEQLVVGELAIDGKKLEPVVMIGE